MGVIPFRTQGYTSAMVWRADTRVGTDATMVSIYYGFTAEENKSVPAFNCSTKRKQMIAGRHLGRLRQN
eukprot:3354406-Rhodomonas_salina.1